MGKQVKEKAHSARQRSSKRSEDEGFSSGRSGRLLNNGDGNGISLDSGEQRSFENGNFVDSVSRNEDPEVNSKEGESSLRNEMVSSYGNEAVSPDEDEDSSSHRNESASQSKSEAPSHQLLCKSPSQSSLNKSPKPKKRRRATSYGNQVANYLQEKDCQICLKKNNQKDMLLCDRCDDSYHQKCLQIEVNLSDQWICKDCELQISSLEIIKQEKMKAEVEVTCWTCRQGLDRLESIEGSDAHGNPVRIQCKSLGVLTCLYCKHSFHNLCFSRRKNSLNCKACESQIRKNGPKSHDEFMEYIERAFNTVRNSDYCLLKHGKEVEKDRLRLFRLKVPGYMSSWQIIAKYEASLYYAFTTKGLTFTDNQIYHNQHSDELLELNCSRKEKYGKVMRLSEKDEKAYEEFKINSEKGFVGPFEVKEDRFKGFYLVATDHIESDTIVSEYSGEVMLSRDAFNYELNDSIFMLVRGPSSTSSLDIVPEKYGNISRFFSGINNSQKRCWSRLQNIKAMRFSYQGKVHILLYTIRPIQAGQTLYFDYNGSAFNEYPTAHFTQ